MQSEDGGWAAFDVDNNWAVLNEVPFADHNAMLDPTCPDITGRVLESLCRRGLADHDAVRRGVAYLLQAQEKDGSWYGRWGVNYIYGSFLAMRGLAVERRSPEREDAIARAARWLRSVQNPDGGWGESLRQLRPRRLCCRAELRLADRLGGAWACWPRAIANPPRCAAASSSCWSASAPDGTWPEDATTGTGFPQRLLPDLRDVSRLFSAAGAGVPWGETGGWGLGVRG